MHCTPPSASDSDSYVFILEELINIAQIFKPSLRLYKGKNPTFKFYKVTRCNEQKDCFISL